MRCPVQHKFDSVLDRAGLLATLFLLPLAAKQKSQARDWAS